MMIDFILLLIINSLFIQGLYRSSMFEWKSNFMYKPNRNNMKIENVDSQYNMILWRFRYYAIKFLGNYWSKPVITCPTCMASIHSSYFYFGFIYLTNQFTLIHALIYIPYVFTLAGLNTLITSLIDND